MSAPRNPESEVRPERRRIGRRTAWFAIFFLLLIVAGIILAAVIIKFAVPEDEGKPTGKPFQMSLDWPKVYVISDQKHNFTSAHAYCMEKYSNGELALVEANDQEDVLMIKVREAMNKLTNRDCKRLFIGFRVMASRVWQSMDHRSFLPSLNIPYQHAFWPDSYDCIVLKLGEPLLTQKTCTALRACAVCETLNASCPEELHSYEGGCYLLETNASLNRSSSNKTRRRHSTVLIDDKVSFNDWQKICRIRHQGRLGAFLHRLVPHKVHLDLLRQANETGNPGKCDGMAAARAMTFAQEFETIYETRMIYESHYMLKPTMDHKMEYQHLCLAIDPAQGFKWVRTACDEPHCFVCTISQPLSKDEYGDKSHSYPDEDEESDLLSPIWG